MTLPAIRQAIAARLALVAGMNQVFPYPPDQPPNNPPCAWIGQASGEIAPHGADLERWAHTVTINVLVHRKGELSAEIERAEVFLEDVVRIFDTAYTLGGLVEGMNFTGYEEGTLPFGGEDYIGFSLTALLRVKVVTQVSG